MKRRADLAYRLRGIQMRGELKPSTNLINMVHEMFEENTLTPLLWSDLTKREAELQGAKVEPMWKPDASGFLRYCNTTTLAGAVTDSEYLLKCAPTRRARAFDIFYFV